jgi:hypothetical protein
MGASGIDEDYHGTTIDIQECTWFWSSENLPKHEWKSRVLFSDSPHLLLKDYRLLPKVKAVEWVAILPPPNPHIPL